MKPFFFATIFLFSIFFVKQGNAQLTKIGGGIVLATGGKYLYKDLDYFNKSFGFNLRAEYDLNKKFKLVPDVQIFLPNKFIYPNGGESQTTLIAFNLNGNYILNPKKDFKFYLLGGIHIGGWSIKDEHTLSLSATDVDFSVFKFDYGVNAGAGLKFKITYRLDFFAEVKYTIAKTNQMVFAPGIIYDI